MKASWALVALALTLFLSMPSVHHTTATSTLSSLNSSASIGQLLHTIIVGPSPEGISYDPSNGYMFVGVEGNGTVAVIDTSTDSLVKNIPLFNGLSGAWGTIYDPSNGLIYVADYNEPSLTVISPDSLTVVGSVTLGTGLLFPWGVTYDPANGDIYVTYAPTTHGVTVYDPSSNSIVGNMTLAGCNQAGTRMAYDPNNDEMYIPSSCDDTLSIVNAKTNALIKSVTLGSPNTNSLSGGIAFDSENRELYVGTGSAQFPTISIVNTTSDSSVGIVRGSSPVACICTTDAVFDQSNGLAYFTIGEVTQSGVGEVKGGVLAVNGTTNTFAGNLTLTNPAAIARNPLNGDLYVVNSLVGNSPIDVIAPANESFGETDSSVYVTEFQAGMAALIDGQTNRIVANLTAGSTPRGIAFDTTNQEIYIANTGVGTVPGNTVSVINTRTNTTLKQITVGLGPIGVAFDFANQMIYVTNSVSGTVSAIDTTSNTVIATVSVGSFPDAASYCSNKRLYVANGGSSSLSVIDPSTNSVVITIPVGSEPSAIACDSLDGNVYSTNIDSNTVSVINSTTNTVVTTIPVGSSPTGISFDETNRDIYVTDSSPGKVTGTVSVIDTQTNQVAENVTVGGFPFGISYDAANKFVYVANSVSNTVSVIEGNSDTVISTIEACCAPTYLAVAPMAPSFHSLTFSQSGLPPGTSWSVDLNGIVKSSTSRTILFSEPNGTFSFTVGSIPGYGPTPSSGIIQVTGASLVQMITFNSSCVAGDQNNLFNTLNLAYGVLSPNLWGLKNAAGEALQCSSATGVSTRIQLSQVNTEISNNNSPFGYPRIGYGHNLYDQGFGSQDNPLVFPTTIRDFIAQNYQTNVTYSLGTVSPSGLPVDFAYDLWLRNQTCRVAPCNPTTSDYELLIALFDSYTYATPSSPQQFTEQIYSNRVPEQSRWNIYTSIKGGTNANLIIFELNMPQQQAAANVALNIGDFITKLSSIENKDLSNYYLMGIELGTEFGNANYNSATWNWSVSDFEVDNQCAMIPLIPSGVITKPTVSCVAPNRGTGYGTTYVTITGSGFAQMSEVDFGANKAVSQDLVSDSEIIAISPAGTGPADITVTNSRGTSTITASDLFNYVSSTGFTPQEGPYSGGSLVIINGSGFTSPAEVWFGTTLGTQVSVVSPTEITAVSPPGSGSVTVTVADNSAGNIPISGADTYTYLPFNIVGNITLQQIANYQVISNPSNNTYTIMFSITGPPGTVGSANMTIPVSSIASGLVPKVYIDGQPAAQQSYSQTADKYVVYFTLHFSTHSVTIRFQQATNYGVSTTPWFNTTLIVAISGVAAATIASAIALTRKLGANRTTTSLKTTNHRQ